MRSLAPSAVLPTLRGSVLAGVALFVAASLQQIGLVYTTAGNAGFITGLYVVLVPVIGIGRRQQIGIGRWAAVLLAAAGLYLLSVTREFTVNPGDIFVVGSALFFAIHVQLIDHLAPRHSRALAFSHAVYRRRDFQHRRGDS